MKQVLDMDVDVLPWLSVYATHTVDGVTIQRAADVWVDKSCVLTVDGTTSPDFRHTSDDLFPPGGDLWIRYVKDRDRLLALSIDVSTVPGARPEFNDAQPAVEAAREAGPLPIPMSTITSELAYATALSARSPDALLAVGEGGIGFVRGKAHGWAAAYRGPGDGVFQTVFVSRPTSEQGVPVLEEVHVLADRRSMVLIPPYAPASAITWNPPRDSRKFGPVDWSNDASFFVVRRVEDRLLIRVAVVERPSEDDW